MRWFVKAAFALALLEVHAAVASISYFWHITDIHYEPSFSVKGDTRRGCRGPEQGSRNGRRPAGRFGDYNCDTPWDLLASAVKAMSQRIEDGVEFVLWTGDAMSASAQRLPQKRQFELMLNVTDLLKHTFSSQFVFPVLGHDDPSSRHYLGELWSRWLPPESMSTFERGGYYVIEQKDRKLQIVVLNTNLLIGATTEDSAEEARKQWEWLDGVLEKSSLNRETVYLVGHVPPGADERQKGVLPATDMSFLDHHNRQYLKIVRKYAKIIVGQFFGHLHSDTFRVLYDANKRPISWMMLSPSLTPRRTHDGPNNPGLRLYKFDSNNGQVLDYTQFYLNLSQANIMDTPEWRIEYNFSTYYGIRNITPATLHSLAENFTYNEPGDLFLRYFVANSVRYFEKLDPLSCDSGCAQAHFCAITKLDYTEFTQCLKAAASALASSGTNRIFLTISSISSSLLICYVCATYLNLYIP